MKKLLKWLLLLIAALSVAVVVMLFNPGLFKSQIETYLSNLTGHSIHLNGELDIDIGRSTKLTATDIQISAPDWASHTELIDIGQFEIAIVVSSIFEKTIILENLQLDDLDVNLERDANGKGNWQAGKSLPETAPATKDKDSEGKRLVIKGIAINSSGLRFHDGKNDTNHVLRIDSFSQQYLTDGMLQTVLKGLYNNRLVEYTGNFGPYQNLLDGRDIRFSSTGHFGELKISGDGLIDSLLSPRQPTFVIDLEGPNVDEITAMLGIEDLGGGGFSLRAQGGQFENHYEAGINGKLGDVSLDVSVQSTNLSAFDELDLELSVNGPSLGAFTRAFGIKHWPDKPFNIKADLAKIGGTLNISGLTLYIGGTQLSLDALLSDFPTLDASRVKLKISGDDVTQFHELLGITGLGTGPFSIDGKLDVSGEGVELLKIELETSLGNATISGTLGDAPAYIGSKLNLHLDGENANSLVLPFGIDALPNQPFNLNTRVELVENGVFFEHGVLLTTDNERLEVGGIITFEPGIQGSELDVKISGQTLAQDLSRFTGAINIPNQPYELAGKLTFTEGSMELADTRAQYEGISLKTSGQINFASQILGSDLSFEVQHDNISELARFGVIGDSLGFLVPGQALQSSGRLTFKKDGWELKQLKGRLGKTDYDIEAMISNQTGLVGSSIQLSMKGSDLPGFLISPTENRLAPGPFEIEGQLRLSDKTLHISELNLESTTARGNIDLELDWPIGDAINIDFNINLQGEDIRNVLPPIDSFEPQSADFNIVAVGKVKADQVSVQKFDADIGDLKVTMTGQLDDDPSDAGVDIDLKVSSNDISTLGLLSGKPLPAQPLELKANFSGSTRDFVIRNLSGSLGDSYLDATLDVSLSGSKPTVKLVANSKYINVAPFINTDKSEEQQATGEPAKDRLIPATPLPLDLLNSADVDIKLNIAELKYTQDSLKDFKLDIDLQAGVLQVQDFSFNAPGGTFSTTLLVQPTDTNNANVKLDVSAEDFIFNLKGVSAEKLKETPTFDVEIHVNGRGSDLQKLAASTNGYITLKSPGGLLEGVDLSILDTFILDEVFSLLMPKSDQPTDEQLSCAAAILSIKNGLIKTTPAVAFTTEKITIVTKGTLDLKTEKMNFNFNATPNNALQISAGELFNPYILISGTLAKPAVGLDPAKALLHGGAAIGTAGISILAKGLLDRVGNASPVCEEMLKAPPPQG